MAQEQVSNLDLSQTKDILEASDADFDNVDFGLVDRSQYDLDAILNEISKLEDLSIADDLFFKLQAELQDRSEYTKHIQQQNADKRSELSSSKYCTSEIEQLQYDEENIASSLRDMNATRRMELDQLHAQQVNNLDKFESDVQKMSDSFMNGPKAYEYESLIEKLVQTKKELENERIELSQYKQDLTVSEGKLKHEQNIKGDLLEKSRSPFEDSVKDITTLNEKLSTSVDLITKRFNTTRFQMSSLNREV